MMMSESGQRLDRLIASSCSDARVRRTNNHNRTSIMASIRQEIQVKATPVQVWDAMRDVGALHVRLVPGFVVETRLEPGARIVTFGNGVVAREAIVDVDDAAMRIVWSASGGRLEHHNASAQVFAGSDGGSRIVWICDLLPNDMRETIDGMIAQGMAAMKRTLDELQEKR
jgi:carbon monoxide dehydrogenase subunit G